MRKSRAVPVHVSHGRRVRIVLGGVLVLMGLMAPTAAAQLPTTDDPRVGLAPGFETPGVASQGLDLSAHLNKPTGFFDPANPGNFAFLNSDLAFQGDYAFVGNFNGYNIYNIANPGKPTLRTSVVCPGGQGDVSVYRNLLFMSVEETRAKTDCTLEPAATPETRFRGVRIFDISNLDNPVQVGGVQTCRGSHTHTLVTDKGDRRNVYVYVQGTAGVRPETELAGCEGPATGPPTGTGQSGALAHRGHQGPARGTGGRRHRQRAAPVHRSGHRSDQRPPERPADPAPPVRDPVAADADHRLLP